MTKKYKKLTGAELKRQVKKLDERDEFYITIDGEEFEVSYDKVFKKSKQIKVLEDMIQLFEESRERAELIEMSAPYVSLMVIKHFTSIEVSDNIDEAIGTLNSLIDLEILHQVINALPEDEILNMFNLVSESVENMKTNLEELNAETEKVSEKVENKELKDVLENGAE